MPFRFLHTADLHLDSPLKSLALRDPALADLIGAATRAVFVRIVDLCLAERVDALLIAGDLYDGDQTSMKTARFLADQLGRLDAAAINTYVIRGNHDALSRLTRELVLPPSVKVFGAKADTVFSETGGQAVAIHGISFAKPHAPDSLLGQFPAPLPDAFNIGMLHTSLAGAPGHDPYAPCSLAALQQTGFDYWALGHVHVRAEYPGRTTVVMPGMPQGRDIGEAGEKSVTLVTMADDGTTTTQMRPLAIARFERTLIAADGLADWPDLVRALGAAIHGARRDLTGDHLVLRLGLTGASPLAWRVRRDLDLLMEQARQVADGIGSVWIETLGSALTHDAPTAETGALADLESLIAKATPPDADLAEIADELSRALPRDLRGLFGDDPATAANLRAALLRDGAADVLARLHMLPEGS